MQAPHGAPPVGYPSYQVRCVMICVCMCVCVCVCVLAVLAQHVTPVPAIAVQFPLNSTSTLASYLGINATLNVTKLP